MAVMSEEWSIVVLLYPLFMAPFSSLSEVEMVVLETSSDFALPVASLRSVSIQNNLEKTIFLSLLVRELL